MSARVRVVPLLLAAWLAVAPVWAVASAAPVPAVAGAAATAADDIRDIHGPVAIPPWWRHAGWLGVPVATVGLLGLAYEWNRRRRRRLTLEERALAELERARALAAAGMAREYAMTASDAVRLYIEERFGVRAAHRTSDEFLGDVMAERDSPLGPHRERLAEFLSACDLAKFARYSLTQEAMGELHELARRFVIETSVPQPATALAAGSAS